MASIKLATYPQHAGKVTTVEGWPVERVTYNQKHDIEYRKYTADYKTYRSRPYIVGKRSFKTLENAVRYLCTTEWRPEE